jgi:hypothetical protein
MKPARYENVSSSWTSPKAGINKLSNKNETLFYDVARAQIDGGAKVSVTNLLTLLHKVKFYSKKFKCEIRMHGATSKDIIQPPVEGYLRVPALTTKGYVEVLCYFSPHFTLTLLEIICVTLVNLSISSLLLMEKLYNKISYQVKSTSIPRDITLIMVLVY